MNEEQRIMAVRDFIGLLTNGDAWELRQAVDLDITRNILLARLAESSRAASLVREWRGVRGAGVVPPELDQSERVPVRDTTPISDGEPAQAEPARLPASPAAPDYVYSSPEATTFVSWLSDQQRNGWCSSEVYDRVRDELNRTVPAAPAPPETERLWALVTQWREAAEYCRTPPTREEIALLWDRVADELKAVLGGSRPSLAGSGLAKLEAARCTLGGSSRTETTWLQARRELAEAYVALRGAEPGRIL